MSWSLSSSKVVARREVSLDGGLVAIVRTRIDPAQTNLYGRDTYGIWVDVRDAFGVQLGEVEVLEYRGLSALSEPCMRDTSTLRRRFDLPPKTPTWIVVNSWVQKSFRGQGLGRQLYLLALATIAAAGPAVIVPHRCHRAGDTSDLALRVWESLRKRFPSQGDAVLVGVTPAGSATREASIPFRTVSLQRGDTIYHGTSRSGFRYPKAPAWFSHSYDTALSFSTWHNAQGGGTRVIEYRVERPVGPLALIRTPGDLRRFVHRSFGDTSLLWERSSERNERTPFGQRGDFGITRDYRNELQDEEDTSTLARRCCELGFLGWIIPNNYAIGEDDILLCSGYEDLLTPVATWKTNRSTWEWERHPSKGDRT